MNRLRLLPILALMLLIGLIPAAAQVDGIIAVAWSPDGRHIAVSGTNGLLQIRDANNQLIRDFPGLTVNIKSVDWSPDSTKIVSGGKDGKVIVWDASSGQQITQLNGFDEYIFQVAWSPDGTKIAATGNRIAPRATLIVWNALTYEQYARWAAGDAFGISWKPDSSLIAVAIGTGYVSIFTPSLGPPIADYQIDAGVLCVSWSPDGSKIALGPSIPGTPVNKVEVRDASTGTLVATYTGHTDYIAAVAFSPNGQYLASASVDGTLRVWSLATGQEIASYTRPPLLTTSIAWSPDGSQLAYASDTDTLQIAPAPGSPTPTPTATPAGSTVSDQAQPTVSGQIVYDVETETGSALVLYDILTGSERFLTDGQFWDWGPELSPSGTQVVFVSDRDGDDNIYLINTDGTALRRLSPNATIDYDPTWSPDGSRIAYVTYATGSSRDVEVRIALINADGTNHIDLNLGDGGGKHPAWSPNGQQLAFVSWRGGEDHLFAVNVDGTGLRQLTFASDIGLYPKWSPDGSKIAFYGLEGVYYIDALVGGTLQRITGNTDAALEGWVSNDTILYTQVGLGGFDYAFTIRTDGTGLTDLNFQLPQGGSAFNLSRVIVDMGANPTPTSTSTLSPP